MWQLRNANVAHYAQFGDDLVVQGFTGQRVMIVLPEYGTCLGHSAAFEVLAKSAGADDRVR
jgi:hypothetical protein